MTDATVQDERLHATDLSIPYRAVDSVLVTEHDIACRCAAGKEAGFTRSQSASRGQYTARAR